MRVAITGLGVVTPIGGDTGSFWNGLMSGRSGADTITHFDPSDIPVRIACEVKDFDPKQYLDGREVGRTDRFTHLAFAAASQAWDAAGCSNLKTSPERIGAIIGTGIGGQSTNEKEHQSFLKGGARRVSPFMVPKLMPNAAAGAVAMKFKITGPNFAPTSACATGSHSIGEACRTIASGGADMMLAGGSESAITPLTISAFARMGALSRRNDEPQKASRPFEANRDGFVCAEGAGVLVLESVDHAESRGAEILAEIVGYGASADAYHVTQPDPKGVGAMLAMRGALREANASPEEVDYINAHGTSTPYNDRVETIAIKEALGVEAKRVAVSSTKSQVGHLLGAAGAVEGAAVVLAIQRGKLPPTINFEEADPECDLDYVGDGPRDATVRLALSNSFGFGGQNACLAFKAPE